MAGTTTTGYGIGWIDYRGLYVSPIGAHKKVLLVRGAATRPPDVASKARKPMQAGNKIIRSIDGIEQ
jgi:hypothetical protein